MALSPEALIPRYVRGISAIMSLPDGSSRIVPTLHRNILKFLDLVAMIAGFTLATLLTYDVSCQNCSLHDFLAMRVALSNFLLFPLLIGIWHASLQGSGLYSRSNALSLSHRNFAVIKSVSLATAGFWLAASIFNVRMVSLTFVTVFWLSSGLTMLLLRWLFDYSLTHYPQLRRHHRQVLIMGTNQRALDAARRIDAHPELGYRVAGFMDDPWTGTSDFTHAGYPLVARLREFKDYLTHNVVDDVMVFVPLRSHYDQIAECLGAAVEQGVAIHLAPDLFASPSARVHFNVVNDLPFISLAVGAVRGKATWIKRSIDVAGGAVLLFMLAPLLAVTAALIKLDSKGPVFFVQDRVGLNKRRFRLYKFRTMVPDAEQRLAKLEHLNEVKGPAFKLTHDPRVTKLGAFLRKTSLDELPQLFNVVKGDMSLVGPRPLPVRDYQGFSTDWHRRRFSVRPGITCLWQIQGRSSIPFERWMELDMEYIDNWSLWLDIKILALTLPAVLKGSGAY